MIDVTVQWRTLEIYQIIQWFKRTVRQPQTDRLYNTDNLSMLLNLDWFHMPAESHAWKTIGLTLNPSGCEYRSSNSWTRTIKINNPGCYSGFKPVMHLEMNFSFIWTSIFKIHIWFFFQANLYPVRGLLTHLKKLNFKELGLKWTIETVIIRPSGSWLINYDVSWASKIATIFWSSGVNRFTNVISKCLHHWPT